MPTILERVIAIVVQELRVDESQVTESADWVQLKADPSELDELFTAIEQAFSIVIAPEVARQLHGGTVGDLVDYLKEHVAEETADV